MTANAAHAANGAQLGHLGSAGAQLGPLNATDAQLGHLRAASAQLGYLRAASAQLGHLRALFAQTPATLAGNAAGMAVVAGSFWPLAPRAHMLGWLALAATLWLLRAAHWLRWRRHGEVDDALLLRWRRSWIALVLLLGGQWGVAVWLFWGLGSPYHRMALVLVILSYAMGSVQLLATQPRIFLVFLAVALLPTVLRVASDGSQPFHGPLAGILVLIMASTWLMGRTYRGALGDAIALKARTEQLAGQLAVEKAAADAARGVAEAASRAKTQFLAAASHDLRQPLHALGLFAEALRQRSREPEVAGLINSINESVDALEGLFAQLLDITRIDSGGVELRREPLALAPLFNRLRLHFEPLAFEKGLALRFRGAAHAVHADALVVERILRNLVGNAIRYTEDGGVLVAARARGDRLLLQVWDSGVGIPAEAQSRVFDEFVQLQAASALPQQRKGLGLGLAIVKRLAGLHGAPLRLQSQPGRGTVFSLWLPRSDAAALPAPAVPVRRAAPGGSLQGRRVLVVDDEPAVREAMAGALQSWGAEVQCFADLAALQAAPLDPPDLAIVDYRLPEGRTGLDALALLRARWPGRALPAIVVTGSSLGAPESEAARHDFHLLVKPVVPSRLRALVGFKLGLR